MKHPHHWVEIARGADGRRLMGCTTMGCIETKVIGPNEAP